MAVGAAVPEQRQTRMRADASRNRERIIGAAREAFLEWGAEVPLDDIARRAGVGNATVYRHFADRNELVYEVTLDSMRRIVDEAESAAAAGGTDPFEALGRFVYRAADARISSLCPMLARGFDRTAPEVVAIRLRLEQAVEGLMEQARRSGQLREDVAMGDLMTALAQLTRPLPGTEWGATFDKFVRRHLQLFLDGMKAPARSELPGEAMTLDDLKPGGP